MDKRVLITLFLSPLFLVSCTRSKERQMADRICECYQPVLEDEEKMSEGYRISFYNLFMKKIQAFYKKVYWLGQMERSMDILSSYDRGYANKLEAEGNLNVLRTLLKWESRFVRGLDFKRPLNKLYEVNVDTYDSTLDHQLRTTLGLLKQHYRQVSNKAEQKMDESIRSMINIKGSKTYEASRAPEGLDLHMHRFFYGVDTTLFRALETDTSLLKKSLQQEVGSRCPGAEKIIF